MNPDPDPDPHDPSEVSDVATETAPPDSSAAGTSVSISVKILGTDGASYSGARVEFAVVSGSGHVSPEIVASDGEGVATTTWTLGTAVGVNQQAVAVVETSSGPRTIDFTTTLVPADPAIFVVLQGDSQMAITGATLPTQILLRLTDTFDNIIVGEPVDLRVVRGGGTVSPTQDTTSANGVVMADWMLGDTVGLQTLNAQPAHFEGPVRSVFATALFASPVQLVKASGDGSTDTVGQELPVPPELQVTDLGGTPLVGLPVRFDAAPGAGRVSDTVVWTDSAGLATTRWTLGTSTLGGPHHLRASVPAVNLPMVTYTAHPLPDVPALIEVDSIPLRQQFARPGNPLTDNVMTRVLDQYRNPVPGATPSYTTVAGSGSVSFGVPTTGSDGRHEVTWTLGGSAGPESLEVEIPGLDTAVGLGATALDLYLDQTVQVFTEGQTHTVSGGFDYAPLSLIEVQLGVDEGVPGGVQSTSLDIDVPILCRPDRSVPLTVSVGSVVSNPITVSVRPHDTLDLGVGDFRRFAADSLCLPIPTSGSRSEYLIGLTRGDRLGLTSLTLSGQSPDSLVTVVRRPRRGGRFPFLSSELTRLWTAHDEAEAGLRIAERRLIGSVVASESAVSSRALAVGDTMTIRIAQLNSLCSVDATVTGVVRLEGPHATYVTDINNPPEDSLTLDDFRQWDSLFTDHVFPVDTTYFGPPPDTDGNGVVVMLFSVEVNRTQAAAWVSRGDLLSSSSCPASNDGEFIYINVPDPQDASGGGARSKQSVVAMMPAVAAHEFVHTIQQGRRGLAGGDQMDLWLAEGQAEIGKEVVGHSVLGNDIGMNYGASVALHAPGAEDWYHQRFNRLARYFGWDESNGKVSGAPEECSITSRSGPCRGLAHYGATWALLRYISDRYGHQFGGGEAELHRELIGRNPGLTGVRNLEALLGVEFDEVFSEWAGSLYLDGRVSGLAPTLSWSSWDLKSIYDDFNAALSLQPTVVPFANFSASRSVARLSTAYFLLDSGGPHGWVSVGVRGSSGGPVTSGVTMWVYRTR